MKLGEEVEFIDIAIISISYGFVNSNFLPCMLRVCSSMGNMTHLKKPFLYHKKTHLS